MKRRFLCMALAIFFVVHIAPAAYATDNTTVYVTTVVAPNGNGTQSSPFNSLEAALQAVADGGTINMLGGNVLNSTDTSSITATLPAKNVVINGNGNQISFRGGIVMGGNLTMNNVELYFSGPSKAGIDRRIYANGYDLSINDCIIGNQGNGTMDDTRGMVVLAGGIKKDIDLGARTQNISINSGRISGIYIGGESGGGATGKVIGNVNVTLSGGWAEFSAVSGFPMAGVFAKGLNSGEKLVDPQLGLEQDGVLSLTVSGVTTGFQKYVGNGGSKISLVDYGFGWQAPVLSGFSELALERTSLETDAAGVKRVVLNSGGNLRLPGSAEIETLEGNGGVLWLSAGKSVAVTQKFTGNAELKIEGIPAAQDETVTYLTAPEGATGTLIYTDKTGTTQIEALVAGGKTLWQIKGIKPAFKEIEVQVSFDGQVQASESLAIELPMGRFPSKLQVMINVRCKNTAGAIMNIRPLRVELSDERYAEMLCANMIAGPVSFWLEESKEGLIPAGDMTITGVTDINGTLHKGSIVAKMVVKPGLDFKLERKEEKNYLIVTLEGASNFAGTIAVDGDYTARQDISSGAVATIPLSGLGAGEKVLSVTFAPTDSIYYRAASATKTVTIIEETHKPDNLELERAAALGVGDYPADDTQVTFAVFYRMLDRVVELSDPDKLEAWKTVTPAARDAAVTMNRYDGMFALYLAAETLGGECLTFNADWWTLHNAVIGPDDCWNEIHLNRDYFSDYDGKDAVLGPGGDYAPWHYDSAAYFYAMGRASLYSGERLFDYDPVSNSMRPDKPFSYTEALRAALRLYDSSADNFPVTPRWPSAAEAELLERASTRKQEILESPRPDLSSITGTTYYVSNGGDDTKDGKTPDTAWASLKRVSDARNNELQPGDAVLFQRGGLWRGTLRCARSVTYSAYGEGAKPRLYGSPENGAGVEKWSLYSEQDGKKIWKFYNDISDCGGIVFNDGAGYASRVFSYWDGTQAVFTNDLNRPFDIAAGLEHNLQFYSTFDMAAHQGEITPGGDYWVHNVDSRGALYLRCDEGNPGERYDSIEFQASVVEEEAYPALGYTGVVACGGDNIIDNLCVMYRSTMGLDRAGTDGNTFQNCEVGWIGGGSHILNYSDGNVRYVPVSGEGIRMEGNNNTTQNCYVHDCFDGGVAVEFDPAFLSQSCANMTIQDNVIERCISGVLIGDHNRDLNNTAPRFGGVTVAGNYIMDSGYGWSCDERYDFTWGSETYNGNAITLWDGPSYNTGIHITNNVLYNARFSLVQMGTDSANSPRFNRNTYAQANNGVVVYRKIDGRLDMSRFAALDDAKTLDICQNGLKDSGAVVLPRTWKPEVVFPVGNQLLLWTGAPAAITPPTVTIQGADVQDSPTYAYRLKADEKWMSGLPTDPGDYEIRARMPGGVEGNYAEALANLTVACFLRAGEEIQGAFPLPQEVQGPCRVLIAIYDGEKNSLLTVGYKDLTAGEPGVTNIGIPATGASLRAKVFVVDAMDTLRPLAPAAAYAVEG